MSDEEFLTLVDAGIDALRDDIKERMHNVAIVIADRPTKEQMEEHALQEGDALFGLYEGIPQTERGLEEGFSFPDKITIFKLPILEAYDAKEDIAACVANTVWHEVAHHFGMEEDEVAQEEIKRGKML